jgi:hypothetical protein
MRTQSRMSIRPFLPMLHTVEEDRWFIANVIPEECEVTVAEDESGIVAFLARKGEEVRLLYIRPDVRYRWEPFTKTRFQHRGKLGSRGSGAA